ncbi:TetR/AcrR family transcriptional regulator [Marinobacteraceae bacterium S3BR75-40.1]
MAKHSLSPRRQPVQSRSIERVERILTHAALLIGERGVGRTSMSGIARAAEMSLASLYRYFPNKEAIIKAIAERHVDRLEEALRGQLSDIDLDQGIDELIDLYADFYRNEPGYAEIWSGVESMPELQALDVEELYRNARDVESTAALLLPDLDRERRRRASILLTRTCGQILRFAMTLPKEEEQGLLAELKVMVRAYMSHLQQDTRDA